MTGTLGGLTIFIHALFSEHLPPDKHNDSLWILISHFINSQAIAQGFYRYLGGTYRRILELQPGQALISFRLAQYNLLFEKPRKRESTKCKDKRRSCVASYHLSTVAERSFHKYSNFFGNKKKNKGDSSYCSPAVLCRRVWL